MKKLLFLAGIFGLLTSTQAQAQTATLVKNFYETPSNYLHIGSTLYFVAGEESDNEELWKTDGTPAGTVRVKDIYPGQEGSRPRNLTNVNGTLFFTATTAANGRELWKSDGTAAGTVLVMDIRPGAESGQPSPQVQFSLNPFPVIQNSVVFFADNGTAGKEPWVSDGTAAGTFMLKDIKPGLSTSEPNDMTEMGNKVYFSARPVNASEELWRTDGTAAGTVKVYSHNQTSGDDIGRLIKMNNTLYFTAFKKLDNSAAGSSVDLMKTDGTTAGTTVVKNLGPYSSVVNPTPSRISNNLLYFTNLNEPTGVELWVSDGTAAGTFLLKDIYPGRDFGTPTDLFDVNGTLYFTATNPTHGRELWMSTGTPASTVLVKDINPGSTDSNPVYFTVYNSQLYFVANDGVHYTDVWRSNGTAAGTAMVFDFGPNQAFPVTDLYNLNNTLYFTGETGNINTDGLYKISGLPTSTKSLTTDNVMRVYPNPTAGKFRLELAKGITVSGVRVYSSQGRLVEELPRSTNIIDLTTYAPGVYFVHLETPQGIVTQKVTRH